MNRIKIVSRVRNLTRDFTNSIFRESDIIDFINEGIERFGQVIPQFVGVLPLTSSTQEPILIPERYQHLLAVYSAARCFFQDERAYQYTTLMNEFETKLNELKIDIENGEVVILDPSTGEPVVVVDNSVDYVDLDPYWGEGINGKFTDYDVDDGVEGF